MKISEIFVGSQKCRKLTGNYGPNLIAPSPEARTLFQSCSECKEQIGGVLRFHCRLRWNTKLAAMEKKEKLEDEKRKAAAEKPAEETKAEPKAEPEAHQPGCKICQFCR